MTMEEVKEIISESIQRHGDGFWNDEDDDGNTNLCLLDDIFECLEKDDYVLQIENK